MGWLANILWLAAKEVKSVFSDTIMVVLIVWSFFPTILIQATGMGETVKNATVAVVDEDRSALSRHLVAALLPPQFQEPRPVAAPEVLGAIDEGRFTFALLFPQDFEADARSGLRPAVQILIDATAVMQAPLGASYIERILARESAAVLARTDESAPPPVRLEARRAFNPNGETAWFHSVTALLDMLSLLAIALTGAAMLREREQGTIAHLMVMPLGPLQIALAKILANGAVVFVAFALSLAVVVRGILDVPVAGSVSLFLAGTALYLAAASAIGVFLGTLARSTAQFALLMLVVFVPMMMLSGGKAPVESQPGWVQDVTWFLPSRHYLSFAKDVVFRGAGADIVWPELLIIFGLGLASLVASLALFRRSLTMSR